MSQPSDVRPASAVAPPRPMETDAAARVADLLDFGSVAIAGGSVGSSPASPPWEGSSAMALLVLKMSVSLDGYVAPRDGSPDWEAAGRCPDGASWVLETVSNASVNLMGAATYASWADFWPTASGPFAKPMNDTPRVVFSNSLESADWVGTTIVSGDLTEAVTRLKQENSGGYLLAQGGARFARSLVRTGLIDEYRLVIHPVVLGSGERLFTSSVTIKAISTTVFSSGAVAHVFAAHP